MYQLQNEISSLSQGNFNIKRENHFLYIACLVGTFVIRMSIKKVPRRCELGGKRHGLRVCHCVTSAPCEISLRSGPVFYRRQSYIISIADSLRRGKIYALFYRCKHSLDSSVDRSGMAVYHGLYYYLIISK